MATSQDPTAFNALLAAWTQGDRNALDRLVPIVYAELRHLARSELRGERDHTLQTTAVVHEAYLRLVSQRADVNTRGQFFGLAAHLMRQVLIDHARRRGAGKRGGGCVLVELKGTEDLIESRSVDVVALDDALTELASADPRLSRVVELRYFAGLTIDETAELMQLSSATVRRDWTMAKAWLCSRIARA